MSYREHRGFLKVNITAMRVFFDLSGLPVKKIEEEADFFTSKGVKKDRPVCSTGRSVQRVE